MQTAKKPRRTEIQGGRAPQHPSQKTGLRAAPQASTVWTRSQARCRGLRLCPQLTGLLMAPHSAPLPPHRTLPPQRSVLLPQCLPVILQLSQERGMEGADPQGEIMTPSQPLSASPSNYHHPCKVPCPQTASDGVHSNYANITQSQAKSGEQPNSRKAQSASENPDSKRDP